MEEQKARASLGGLRTISRFRAVQMVYRATMTGLAIGKMINEAKKHAEVILAEDVSVSETDFEFFQLLLETTEKYLEQTDELISKNLSSNWKIDRLDPVMKAVLRLGITELIYFKDVPTNVVFNEYIEIAKSFFEKSEVAFVNGLLNSALRQHPRDQTGD